MSITVDEVIAAFKAGKYPDALPRIWDQEDEDGLYLAKFVMDEGNFAAIVDAFGDERLKAKCLDALDPKKVMTRCWAPAPYSYWGCEKVVWDFDDEDQVAQNLFIKIYEMDHIVNYLSRTSRKELMKRHIYRWDGCFPWGYTNGPINARRMYDGRYLFPDQAKLLLNENIDPDVRNKLMVEDCPQEISLPLGMYDVITILMEGELMRRS